MIKQIKKVEPLVEGILEKHPEARDNDGALYSIFVYVLDPVLRNPNTEAVYLLGKIKNGDYPAMESITRARRKVQERREDLRGNRYKDRKVNEKEVREGINE